MPLTAILELPVGAPGKTTNKLPQLSAIYGDPIFTPGKIRNCLPNNTFATESYFALTGVKLQFFLQIKTLPQTHMCHKAPYATIQFFERVKTSATRVFTALKDNRHRTYRLPN